MAGIDEIRIADLVLVGCIDHGVLEPAAIGAPGDSPQAIAGLDDGDPTGGQIDDGGGAGERYFDTAGDAAARLGECLRIWATTGPGEMCAGRRRSASAMMLVTREARFASTKIGSMASSTSPGDSDRLSSMARC